LRGKQNIKEGIEGHPVSWYSDVFDLVFPDVDAEEANNLWKAQLAETEARGKHGKGGEESDEE
jgi:ATP-dependent Lon protease